MKIKNLILNRTNSWALFKYMIHQKLLLRSKFKILTKRIIFIIKAIFNFIITNISKAKIALSTIQTMLSIIKVVLSKEFLKTATHLLEMVITIYQDNLFLWSNNHMIIQESVCQQD
jgi:hypothetical protein